MFVLELLYDNCQSLKIKKDKQKFNTSHREKNKKHGKKYDSVALILVSKRFKRIGIVKWENGKL